MSKPQNTQNDKPSAKTITRADRPSESSTAGGNMLSKAITSLKSVWKDSSSASARGLAALQLTSLPISKELPTVNDLEALTISELVDNLDYLSVPRLNPKHPALQRKGSDIIQHKHKTPNHASSKETDTFLRADIKGQAKELRLELEIARAKFCWIDRNYRTMLSCSMEMLELSHGFGHIKNVARACFYISVAYFGISDFTQGQQYLNKAEKCKVDFEERHLINSVRKEAELYEKRPGKKRALPNKHGVDKVKIPLTGRSSEISNPITAEIPGRAWQSGKRMTSASPPPARNAQTQRAINKNLDHLKSRATMSPAPNLNSLSDELEKFDSQDEETADD